MFQGIGMMIGSSRGNAAASSLLTGINSYWKFDETSGNAIDQVAAYHATITGGVTQNVAGKINTCYTFNGSTGYLLGAATIFSSTVFSYSAWVKTSSGTTQGVICPTSNYNTVPYFRVNDVYVIELVERGIGTIGITTGTITSGSWQHIACTYNQGTGAWEIFINGTSSASGTYVAGTFTFDDLIFGMEGNGLPSGGGGGQFFNGQLDEIGIWNRVLTGAEITTLYNSGTGLSYPF